MADLEVPAMEALAARIDNLEMRITHQDEIIEVLNRTIVEQWGKLDQALAHIKRLEERIREVSDGSGRDAYDEPPPPHY